MDTYISIVCSLSEVISESEVRACEIRVYEVLAWIINRLG